MSSDAKKDEDTKKEGFFKKMFSAPGKGSSTDKPKKHTNKIGGLGKTSKHSGGNADQKNTHDESPDAGHGEKDPNPDQVLRDSTDACK
ncbi:unnamed protein product [Hydatigera taeniaeformis]|uniref:Zgc: n=1 Tax=Hydatigena taeniaeformis TaxID=6205 RepID=A0A0R3X5U8_HYDTA|nr:unnamed protein product [Hydatigera taeniaeformis]